jgi:hypothetical protein
MKAIPNWTRQVATLGLGSTVTMDLGGEIIRRATGVPPLDYRLLGRWIGHMRHGQFAHTNIAESDPVRGEKALGTVAHYAIGTSLAGVLLLWKPNYPQQPTLVAAMTVGIASTVFPFFLMQPAFGLGVAASKTPQPSVARLRSARAHTIYGMGLFATGSLTSRYSSQRRDRGQQTR